MPGTPSGENHSSASHACGRKRIPRLSSSAYRRRIWRLSAERSEEHTSELQSQSNLVCRLLLEKKKQIKIQRRARNRAQFEISGVANYYGHLATVRSELE